MASGRGRAAAVLLALGLLTACGSDSVTEPNVVGDTQAAASTALTGAGLTLGTVTPQSSTTVAAGLIISQSPAASTSVVKGTVVTLVVSSGPPTVAAPGVVGDAQAAATTALTGAGLTLGTVSMASSTTIAPGKVISQSPASGTTVVVGSAVNLVVSSGVTFGGVVAAGAAVANNPGYALDAVTGTQIPFTTHPDGSYSVDVFGYTGPFLLHVLGLSTGGTPVNLYSLAAAATSAGGTTVNVTPLSDLILGYAAGVTTANLEATCTGNLPACPALLNGILASLTPANAAVVAAIPASVWAAFGITPATFNAITSQFATTHTGVDGLLDALSIVPPATTGASYTVMLVGAPPTTLATVPTSGTAGTEGGAPTEGAIPSPASVAQGANLAAVEPEIQAFFASISALFATALPTPAQVQALLAPGFLQDGMTASAYSAYFPTNESIGFVVTGGGVAPYSGAQYTGALGTPPGPAITYDANNCVTSIWVYVDVRNDSLQLVDTIPATNSPGVCTGGTWLFAGNQRTYRSVLNPVFKRTQTQLNGTGATYTQGLQLDTLSSQTPDNPGATAPYSYVAFGGPGLTTVGAYQAGQPDTGFVILIPAPIPAAPAVVNNNNSIANSNAVQQFDPYYGSGNLLQSCAAVIASGVGPNSGNPYNNGTPCYDSNLVAGSDYGVGFFDAGFNLLALEQERLNVSPATTVVPQSYYPTITSISPASAASIATGSTVTTVTVVVTAPAGSSNGEAGLALSVNNVGSIFGQVDSFTPFSAVTTTTYTNTFSVSGLSQAPTNGVAGTDIMIGGLHVYSSWSF